MVPKVGKQVKPWGQAGGAGRGQKVEQKQRSGSVSCISEARGWRPEDRAAAGREIIQEPDVAEKEMRLSTFLSSTWFHHPNPPCIWFYLDLSLDDSPILSWTPFA